MTLEERIIELSNTNQPDYVGFKQNILELIQSFDWSNDYNIYSSSTETFDLNPIVTIVSVEIKYGYDESSKFSPKASKFTKQFLDIAHKFKIPICTHNCELYINYDTLEKLNKLDSASTESIYLHNEEIDNMLYNDYTSEIRFRTKTMTYYFKPKNKM